MKQDLPARKGWNWSPPGAKKPIGTFRQTMTLQHNTRRNQDLHFHCMLSGIQESNRDDQVEGVTRQAKLFAAPSVVSPSPK